MVLIPSSSSQPRVTGRKGRYRVDLFFGGANKCFVPILTEHVEHIFELPSSVLGLRLVSSTMWRRRHLQSDRPRGIPVCPFLGDLIHVWPSVCTSSFFQFPCPWFFLYPRSLHSSFWGVPVPDWPWGLCLEERLWPFRVGRLLPTWGLRLFTITLLMTFFTLLSLWVFSL